MIRGIVFGRLPETSMAAPAAETAGHVCHVTLSTIPAGDRDRANASGEYFYYFDVLYVPRAFEYPVFRFETGDAP